MKEQPTEEELKEIVAAIQKGDRILATSIYISSTGKGLGDAQRFVRELREHLNSGGPRKE